MIHYQILKKFAKLQLASSIKVTGKVVKTENAKQPFEIQAIKLKFLKLI